MRKQCLTSRGLLLCFMGIFENIFNAKVLRSFVLYSRLQWLWRNHCILSHSTKSRW